MLGVSSLGWKSDDKVFPALRWGSGVWVTSRDLLYCHYPGWMNFGVLLVGSVVDIGCRQTMLTDDKLPYRVVGCFVWRSLTTIDGPMCSRCIFNVRRVSILYHVMNDTCPHGVWLWSLLGYPNQHDMIQQLKYTHLQIKIGHCLFCSISKTPPFVWYLQLDSRTAKYNPSNNELIINVEDPSSTSRQFPIFKNPHLSHSPSQHSFVALPTQHKISFSVPTTAQNSSERTATNSETLFRYSVETELSPPAHVHGPADR